MKNERHLAVTSGGEGLKKGKPVKSSQNSNTCCTTVGHCFIHSCIVYDVYIYIYIVAKK